MSSSYKKYLPKKETILKNKIIRWIGPAMLHPQLWRFSRRGVALGVGIGIFFGFLIPLAQIPVSAISASILRANVPTAIASTLITNPVTFAPIYVIAYKLGNKLLGEKPDPKSIAEVSKGITPSELPVETQEIVKEKNFLIEILGFSKPLLVGLGIFAVAGSITTYFGILWFWWIWIKLKRSKRKRRLLKRKL